MSSSARGWDDGFDEWLDWVKANKRHLTGVSFHWIRGGRWRGSVDSADKRRDLDDMPGIRTEADEADFDESDTDVDP